MDYLSNLELIHKIADSILQPKQSVYSDDPIYMMLQSFPHLGLADPAVHNRHKEKLKVSLFYHHGQLRKTCIVFMHGFGSNRIQAINILPYLPKNISLCCFDFSAEGKSQGKQVTYGHKEKDDIRAVLGYLRSCKYDNFILWGRSMGAASTLLYTIHEKPQDVALQILDSPYSSFAEVALQLTKKKVNIPDVILTTALTVVQKNCQNKNYNPFKVDFNSPINSPIPTIFVYSEHDDVINFSNSMKIINNFSGHYEKLIIKQNHNVVRSSKTIKRLVQLSKQYALKKSLGKKPEQKINTLTLSCQKMHSSKKIISHDDSFDNYGIWVISKPQNSQKNNKKLLKLSQSQQYSHKQRPKSSTRDLSIGDSPMWKSIQIIKKPTRDKQLLSQSIVSRTTSHSVGLKSKKFRHLSHQLYL